MIGDVPRRYIAIAAAALGLTAGASALVSHELIGSNAANLQELRQQQGQVSNPVPFLGPYAMHVKGWAQCGPGVRLMEGALRNAKVRKGVARNCIGPATVKQLAAFQHQKHIPVSGRYGLRTHQALSRYYNKTQRAALVYLATARRDAIRRATILVVTSHARAYQGRMQYCEYGSLASCGRRGVFPPWPDVPRHTDCSGYASWVLITATGINPNGIGIGSTRTLIYHGVPVRPNGPLKVGDLIFYGSNSHVEVYIGHGLTSGHGSFGIHIHPFGYRFIYGIRRYF